MFFPIILNGFYVHFLCLPKENEPAAKRRKKGQPFTRRVIKLHRWFDGVEVVVIQDVTTIAPLCSSKRSGV
jgi:hypothetical protein